MILIGENIHIVSKTVKDALLSRDETFIKNIIQQEAKMNYIDLNVGPAKGEMQGILVWLSNLVEKTNKNLKISFDTTNFDEMKSGINSLSNVKKSFLNSTSCDEPKLSKMLNLAIENDCNLIALTMDKENGIPKTSDGRLEIAFQIYEKAMETGFNTENLFFDPLILPVTADQTQAQEAINTIKMIKESFDPPVKTVIGLSNVSNGCPSDLRPVINRVMAVLCYGAGLDAVIMDAKDEELIRIFNMLNTKTPENSADEIYLKLIQMIEDFSNIDEIEFDKSDKSQVEIIKTVRMLLGKTVYSPSFLNI